MKPFPRRIKAAMEPENEVVIRFDRVTKYYPSYSHVTGGIKNVLFRLPQAIRSLRHRHLALADISFTVKRGECVGIWGRNGAGKSTTLGLIAGVLKPSSGTIEVRGTVTPLLQLGAGFHPDLTGRENILLNGMLLGMRRKQVREREADIIAFADIGEFIDEPIRTYSSGMLTRLGFSVAIHSDPEILLLDEILAVGDVDFRKKCTDRLMKLRSNGVTMVMVSHVATEMARYCDRAIIISDHHIVAEGAPRDILPLSETPKSEKTDA